MATRSLIIRKNEDKFDVIYHHWDGYVEGLGYFLNKHFKDLEKLEWLFSHKKDFSSIMHSIKKSDLENNDGKSNLSLSMYNEDVNKIIIPSFIINDEKKINYISYYCEENERMNVNWEAVLKMSQGHNYIFDSEWFIIKDLEKIKDYDKNNLIKLSEALNFQEIYMIKEGLLEKSILNEDEVIDVVIKKVKSAKKIKQFLNFLKEDKNSDFFKYWGNLNDLKKFAENLNDKVLNKKIQKSLQKELSVSKKNKRLKM